MDQKKTALIDAATEFLARDTSQNTPDQITESVRVAKKAAEEAHSKGLGLEDADRHIYHKVLAHHSGKSQGASGMVTRLKVDQATDSGVAHFKKLSGAK